MCFMFPLSLEREEELIHTPRWRQHLYTDPCVLESIQMRNWLEEVWRAASAALWSDSRRGWRGTSRPSPWSTPYTPGPPPTGRLPTPAPSETSGSDGGDTRLESCMCITLKSKAICRASPAVPHLSRQGLKVTSPWSAHICWLGHMWSGCWGLSRSLGSYVQACSFTHREAPAEWRSVISHKPTESINITEPTWGSEWPGWESCTGTALPHTPCPLLSSEQQRASLDFLVVKQNNTSHDVKAAWGDFTDRRL